MENKLKEAKEVYDKLLKEKGYKTIIEWARTEGKDIEGMAELLELIENNDFCLILLLTEYNVNLEKFLEAYPNGNAEVREALAKAKKEKTEFIEISDPLVIDLILSQRKLIYASTENAKIYQELEAAYNLRDTPEKIVLKRNTKNVFIKCNI